MFIREYKTYKKKANETYVQHRLVESVWTEKGSRQRIIMNLGRLTLPRHEWKRLAHALECQLTGQQSLLTSSDKEIERLALSLASNMHLSKELQKHTADEQASRRELVTIDIKSVGTSHSRTVGPETACQTAWELLGFEKILASVGFSRRELALARAVIFGRMISPGSERHTYHWFQKSSALTEFPGADITGIGKDAFYEIGDTLYAAKDSIEEKLYAAARKLYPQSDSAVYLYDLTNTYMEGSSLGNALAARGHCKSKRTDCPLITLSLVVRNDGLPVTSHIYKGNQSEPETMEAMIGRLDSMMWDNQTTFAKPTIIMDRGIATQGNVDYLRNNGYQYVVVKREDESEVYRSMFEEERDQFKKIGRGHISAYGDENDVYVRKIAPEAEGGICKVLCISDGKARKEKAIDSRKERRFLEGIHNVEASIAKGSIKRPSKVAERLLNLARKHPAASKLYDVEVLSKDGKNTDGIVCVKKPQAADGGKLYGCYVLETTHTEMDDIAIWNLYMSQTKVESAFRVMKSELGMRPVYHQTSSRSAAHLFVTVLAYHLLSLIERELEKAGDFRLWSTICDTLATHTRNTVIMRDKDGNNLHYRVNGNPEDLHTDIYEKLKTKNPLKPTLSKY